jgi:hypothetical protein
LIESVHKIRSVYVCSRLSLRFNDHHGAYGHEFFTKNKFDWESLHHRSMPAPMDPQKFMHECLHSLQTPRTARGTAQVSGLRISVLAGDVADSVYLRSGSTGKFIVDWKLARKGAVYRS